MKRSLLIGLGTSILIFSGLAFAAEKRPPWIDGEAPFYSEQEYLTGVGYGNSRKEAEDQAYAAIAKIFRVQVETRTREVEELHQGAANGQAETRRSVDLGQITEVSTQKVLENVKLSEHWEEPETHVRYVLATLFRPQAAASLTDKIQGLDRATRDTLAQAKRTEDRLPHFRALRRAERSLLLREAYNADLRVVQRSGKGIDPPVSLSAMKEIMDLFLSEDLRLSVVASGPEAEGLRAALVEGLSHQGFHIIKEDASDLLVRGEGEMQEADLQNPQFKFVRWEVRLDLIEGKAGKTIGSAGQTGREGHLTLAEAKVRARHGMQQAASGPLIEELFKALDGPEE